MLKSWIIRSKRDVLKTINQKELYELHADFCKFMGSEIRVEILFLLGEKEQFYTLKKKGENNLIVTRPSFLHFISPKISKKSYPHRNFLDSFSILNFS